jgi:hypothetical protein
MKYKILAVLLLGSCVIYGNERGPVELKKPGDAVALSLAWTLLPSLPLLACMGGHNVDGNIAAGSILLSASGFVFGPSAGHFYAENSARGYKSIGIRTTFVLVGVAGTFMGFANLMHEDYSTAQTGATIAIASGICILGSAAYDIFTCPQSVEKYNQSIRGYGGLYFSPEIDIINESYGLSLAYRF